MQFCFTYYLDGFLTFGRWRLHRRIFHQSFRQAAIPAYHAELRRDAQKMLFSFLQDPTNYSSHFKMLVTTIHIDLVLYPDIHQVYFFIYTVYRIRLSSKSRR